MDKVLGIRLIPHHVKIGLVIGTYGTPAYIHLFLESARRNFPHVPILVHDDCSGCEELTKIISIYGQELSTNESHCGHGIGDIRVISAGLKWANSLNLDILVKMSRRFMPFLDWTAGLVDVALKSQHVTYANKCIHFKFPLRSECFGMHVPSWIKRQDDLEKLAVPGCKVEQDVFEFIKDFKKPTCYINENYITKNISIDYFSQYYGIWHDIGDNRIRAVPQILWHDCCDISMYFSKSMEYNLPYNELDFIV